MASKITAYSREGADAKFATKEVANKDEQAAARLAAKTAGVNIVGWAVGSAAALAAVKGT